MKKLSKMKKQNFYLIVCIFSEIAMIYYATQYLTPQQATPLFLALIASQSFTIALQK